jgi:hypothetical protein
MFCRADKEEVTQLMNKINNTYRQASGQLVNFNKSDIMFSKHVQNDAKETIEQILPMQRVDHFSKYLGMPTYIGRTKNRVFNFIQDKVWKK